MLVGLSLDKKRRWETEEHLEELSLLADTAGALVVERVIQERRRIDSATFIGRGKVAMLSERVEDNDIDLVIFDDDLSPAQIANLEKALNKKILDRSGLILDIFARRAKTREARTQVELAQLNYLLPRLTRQWTHLSRQEGGIGTRGPGETQLEVDRRLIRKRIRALTKQLDKIKKHREVRRKNRDLTFRVALVGYPNAGKSTLLNTLTDSDVFVEDRLFATLDATIRRLNRVGDRPAILLIDTVGFIRKLPHHLVASFMSTLEEAKVADLLLHIVDVSHPHLKEHISVVNAVLHDLHISEKPSLYVFNKIDKLEQKGLLANLKSEFQPAIFVSAVKGLFLEDLKHKLGSYACDTVLEWTLRLPLKESGLLAGIYELAQVLETNYVDSMIEIKLRASKSNAGRIKRMTRTS
ncbi:MAG: GTPase HflX [bacterium]